MSKEEIISFIYYLWDKIDPVYLKEVEGNIKRFLKNLNR